jgi:hypothetical protein
MKESFGLRTGLNRFRRGLRKFHQLSEINFSMDLISNLHITSLYIDCQYSLLGRLVTQTEVIYGHPLYIHADPCVKKVKLSLYLTN